MRTIMLMLILMILVGCASPMDDTVSEDTNTEKSDDMPGQPSDESDIPVQPDTKMDEPESMGEAVVGTFNSILGLGRSIKCTVAYEEDGSEFDQVTYFSNDKFRSDIKIDDQGESFESHVVSDGTWIYVWSSIQAQGTKFKMEDIKNDPGDYDSVDMEREYDFRCIPWIADNSKFSPPSGIEFVDMGEMMQDMADSMPTQEELDQMTADACSLCDNAPSEAEKAACKEGLDC